MKYDLSQLEERIKERKRIFKIKTCVYLLVFIVAVVIIALNYGNNDSAVFYSGLAIVVLIFVFASTMRKYSPGILFSREISGINIKEDEYVLLSQKRGYKAGKYSKYVVPHIGSGMLSHRERIVAAVYLRLDDGDVYLIDRISTIHTDLYEIGDRLYKPAGVKYPIIVSRESERQPCPFCGKLNDATTANCQGCGLNIFK